MKEILNTFNSQNLIEHPTMKGFYQIPGFSNYYMNKSGEVFSLFRNKVLPTRPVHPSHRYKNTYLCSDKGDRCTIHTHRLICLMFKNDGKDKSNLQVDHVDGNRYNNSFDNLEWVTPSENVLRSFKLGLRDRRTVPVLVRNFKTKEIREFSGLREAGPALGLHHSTVFSRCSNHNGKVYPDGYQYKFKHDTSPWVDDDSEIIKYGVNAPLLVKDHMTGTIHKFDKSKDACVFFQISPAMVSTYLNDDRQLLSERLLQFKPDDDLIPWREIKDPYLDLVNTNKLIKPVTIINSITGEKHHFVSAADAAAFAGILTTTLHWRLIDKGAGVKVYSDGYMYKYYDGK